MIAKINNVEFEATNYVPYNDNNAITVIFYLLADSTDAIIAAAGKEATVEIVDSFFADNVKIAHILTRWEDGRMICEVGFKSIDIMDAVQNNSINIEIIAQAIEELAEIIG